ncbi:unnamed protein product [Dovyalis caffra]|uniref:Uncharacterized protein n=1 Tax=Dovyalis caffra TaxID=77055 RepID=A0AAV1SHF5_9ROSI|nr:unnamed protein product [Dovyalis caffra]
MEELVVGVEKVRAGKDDEGLNVDEDPTMSEFLENEKGSVRIERAECGDRPKGEINIPSDLPSMITVRKKKEKAFKLVKETLKSTISIRKPTRKNSISRL